MTDAIATFVSGNYVAIRIVHVLSAMLWAFSTIAPMRFYVRPTLRAAAANPQDLELQRRRDWVIEQFDHVVAVEHWAFGVLLASGVLLYAGGAASLEQGWFAAKMAIVVLVFIPIEIYDIWITHVAAPRAVRLKAQDRAAYDAFRERWLRFIRGVTPLILVFVPAALLLAMAKPF